MHSYPSKVEGDETDILALISRLIWLHQHLAKGLQLLWTSYFLCEEWKFDDVEELLVQLVRLLKVFLLHRSSYTAMLAV